MTAATHTLSKPQTRPFASIMLQILGGSLFIALCAQIQIPLPFTPVPITLQTLAAAFVGAILGKNRGSLAVLAYLAETSLGMPFLAGGACNPLALIGPTGGYLIGMVVQAYLVGWFYEIKMGRHFSRDFLYNAFSGIIVLVCGCLWLSAFIGPQNVLFMGFYPFLIGDVLKSVVITRVMMGHHRIRL